MSTQSPMSTTLGCQTPDFPCQSIAVGLLRWRKPCDLKGGNGLIVTVLDQGNHRVSLKRRCHTGHHLVP